MSFFEGSSYWKGPSRVARRPHSIVRIRRRKQRRLERRRRRRPGAVVAARVGVAPPQRVRARSARRSRGRQTHAVEGACRSNGPPPFGRPMSAFGRRPSGATLETGSSTLPETTYNGSVGLLDGGRPAKRKDVA